MDILKDPVNDRQVKTLKPPPHRPLSKNLMFPDKLKNKPDWKLLKDHLQREGRVAKEELFKLVADCNKLLKNEGNVLYLQDPLTVVGDTLYFRLLFLQYNFINSKSEIFFDQLTQNLWTQFFDYFITVSIQIFQKLNNQLLII